MDKYIEKVSEDLAFQIDRYVKLHIKPRPRYLPAFIWRWLLKNLLVLHEFDSQTKQEGELKK